MEIVVFGDSITYGLNDEKGGWVARLQNELQKEDIKNRRHVANGVYNCGVRGDTTEDLLKRFDAECSSRVERQDNPTIIFAIGTNDCSVEYGSNKVSAINYKENLVKLLEKARSAADKIIFVGLFPVDETKTTPIIWHPERSYDNKHIEQYNTLVKEFCKTNGLIFVDVFKTLRNKAYQVLLSDGLHPNSKGHQKIYKLVSKALRKSNLLP